MSNQPFEPIRSKFGQGYVESAGEYSLYRRLSILTRDDELIDDSWIVLRFQQGQILQEDFIPEIQTAILDDLEMLRSVRNRDWDNIAGEHEGKRDSDYELESPYTQQFLSVDTLYALKTPQGSVFPLYEMQKNFKDDTSSEKIEMQIRKGLERVIKPQPIMPELTNILRKS